MFLMNLINYCGVYFSFYKQDASIFIEFCMITANPTLHINKIFAHYL
ncbi:hypothetical protein YPPY13_1237 [Yersinia pestis PY-13]|uniref:Uncharacterized protein n=2 Tax=Yersinia pestis TaxID=632 RepID=A0AB72ZNU1_YERPE|nr:hypothetical protein YPD27_1113 [Yersinia pestis KIM D27]EIR07069.1 hypothetical protein YPPY05_1182 [Yersinia pestis PY-05]EIR10445.1 hypothetical protein YPPY06_1214 [Yersinia pestis PY-06]EIR21014.1 hypothetical protein YPPY07_1121 [Yersinia pestis PY-07]EIR22099.1 hypothetical protein YPPY08_1223 [Yersinia pestis PY-08]EIR49791.1 hypothetical protein YPPY13_1237 [Yersinia pestis PY-13]EIR63973.1 hypothetical protein YPPY16_1244 [Yersinia pestis PY-16]EIR80683.1 hypothetical protein YP